MQLVSVFEKTNIDLDIHVHPAQSVAFVMSFNMANGGGGTGFNGWSPVLADVEDGDRVVQQVSDWIGGTGLKPEAGMYISTNGFTNDISQATNIRGPEGGSGGDYVTQEEFQEEVTALKQTDGDQQTQIDAQAQSIGNEEAERKRSDEGLQEQITAQGVRVAQNTQDISDIYTEVAEIDFEKVTSVGASTSRSIQIAEAVNESQATTLGQVQRLISKSKEEAYLVVDSLPNEGVEGTTYLVKTPDNEDVYDKYVWEKFDGVYQWVFIGTTSIDLSDYYQKSEINAMLAQKADIGQIPTKVSQLANDSGFTTIKTKTTTLPASSWSAYKGIYKSDILDPDADPMYDGIITITISNSSIGVAGALLPNGEVYQGGIRILSTAIPSGDIILTYIIQK